MTLKRRLERLEQVSPPHYSDVAEMPTHALESLVRKAFLDGNHSAEERRLYRRLKGRGFEFSVAQPPL
jgi:hypothetical protein